MKNIILSIFLMAGFVCKAQTQLNQYKYVVVPKKFDGFKKENQYQTSTLVKHLFSQKGFNTIYDDGIPDELNSNRCLGLFVSLREGSSLFSTKTALVLKDCSGEEVFVTKEGRSKQKEYRQAYSEAINNAFDSFDNINYVYTAKVRKEESMVDKAKDATTEDQGYKNLNPVASEIKNKEADKKEMVEQVATQEEQSYKNGEPLPSEMKKADSNKKAVDVMVKKMDGVLYAQELSNGFQLVDSTPKIQFKIYRSSVPDVFIAKGDGKDGLVYAKEGKWFLEYYEGEKLMIEELNIKF